MLNYIFNKITYAFLVLLGVVTIIFFLFNVMPADPAKMMLGDRDDETQLKLINAKYHFDKPLSKQFLYYLNDLSPISFHDSSPNYPSSKEILSAKSFVVIVKKPYLRKSFYQKNVYVTDLIDDAFPNTIVLALTSISFALFIGVPLGVLAAFYKDKIADKIISIVSVLGMSLPSFLAAVLIGYIFAYKLGWFNITGSLFVLDDLGEHQNLSLQNLILPLLTLGIRPLAVIVNLTRNALIDELSSDYVLLAQSKGLSMLYVIIFHSLKNSMTSVVTAASGWFAGMLSGAVFVEYIFGWNGLGKLLVDALISVDFPLVMGIILVISTCFIIINILVDLIYVWLDPRVKIG